MGPITSSPRIEVLFNLAKFFDTLRPQLVAETAVKLGYPTRVLVLGLIGHMATTRIKVGNAFSK